MITTDARRELITCKVLGPTETALYLNNKTMIAAAPIKTNKNAATFLTVALFF